MQRPSPRSPRTNPTLYDVWEKPTEEAARFFGTTPTWRRVARGLPRPTGGWATWLRPWASDAPAGSVLEVRDGSAVVARMWVVYVEGIRTLSMTPPAPARPTPRSRRPSGQPKRTPRPNPSGPFIVWEMPPAWARKEYQLPEAWRQQTRELDAEPAGGWLKYLQMFAPVLVDGCTLEVRRGTEVVARYWVIAPSSGGATPIVAVHPPLWMTQPPSRPAPAEPALTPKQLAQMKREEAAMKRGLRRMR